MNATPSDEVCFDWKTIYVIICLENIIFLPLSFWLKQSRFCHLDILTSFCALEIEIYCGYVIDVSMILPSPIWKIKGNKNLTLISMVLVNNTIQFTIQFTIQYNTMFFILRALKWTSEKLTKKNECSLLLPYSIDFKQGWHLMTRPNSF